MSRNDVKTSLDEEVNQSGARVLKTNDTVLVIGFMFIDLVDKVRESVIIKAEKLNLLIVRTSPLELQMQESMVLSERSTPIQKGQHR